MPLIGRRNAWLALQRLFGRDREPAKSVDFISRYFWPYLTIVSGSLGRLAIQAGYFLVLANTLSISNFGIFAAVSGAGIMIGSFTCFGFSAAAFRAAATRRSTLFGAYVAGVYGTCLLSIPVCLGAAALLYVMVFEGRLSAWSFAGIAISDIVLWRVLEVVVQLNNGLGAYGRASLGAMLGSAGRLVAAIGLFVSGSSEMSDWAAWYFWCNLAATAAYLATCRPVLRLRWRRSLFLIKHHIKDSLLFAVSFFVFYAQSELDKLIVLLMANARIAGIYSISMRVVDLTAVPIRSFLLLLVREIMAGRGPGVRWKNNLIIEGWIGSLSFFGFVSLLGLLYWFPNMLGGQINVASELFMLMVLVPPLRNLQEYHAELFFAWNRMGVRASSVILLTVLKAGLLSYLLLRTHDLTVIGIMTNGVFAVAYLFSEAIVVFTFFASGRTASFALLGRRGSQPTAAPAPDFRSGTS